MLWADMKTTAYLTRKELAQRWKCSLTTIRRMEAREQIVSSRLSSRLIRFPIEDVLRVESEASSVYRSKKEGEDS